ncbi:MAG: hypothetical protein LBV51_04860 [Acholeplasmatales bacterium]|jgi:hypothetical protein|nr:hypothetical protein [Acholeplasmatales bacterium]
MKKIISVLVLFLFSALLFSCQGSKDYAKQALEKELIVYANGQNQASVTSNLILNTTVTIEVSKRKSVEVAISWESSDASTISTDGNVTRPSTNDKNVSLTATATYLKQVEKRTFGVVVLKQSGSTVDPNDGAVAKLAEAKQALVLAVNEPSNVTTNFSVHTELIYSVSVVWSSNNSAVISFTTITNKIQTVQVTRLEDDKPVVLTATLSLASEKNPSNILTDTKTFNIIVKGTGDIIVPPIIEEELIAEINFTTSSFSNAYPVTATTGTVQNVVSNTSLNASVLRANVSVPTGFQEGDKALTISPVKQGQTYTEGYFQVDFKGDVTTVSFDMKLWSAPAKNDLVSLTFEQKEGSNWVAKKDLLPIVVVDIINVVVTNLDGSEYRIHSVGTTAALTLEGSNGGRVIFDNIKAYGIPNGGGDVTPPPTPNGDYDYKMQYTSSATEAPTSSINYASKVGLPTTFSVTSNVIEHNGYTLYIGLNKNGSIRLYENPDGNGSILTIVAPSNISNVVISFGSNNAGANVPILLNNNPYTISGLDFRPNSAQFPNNEVVQNFAVNSNTLVIENKATNSNQLHIWYIEFYMGEGGGGDVTPPPTPDPDNEGGISIDFESTTSTFDSNYKVPETQITFKNNVDNSNFSFYGYRVNRVTNMTSNTGFSGYYIALASAKSDGSIEYASLRFILNEAPESISFKAAKWTSSGGNPKSDTITSALLQGKVNGSWVTVLDFTSQLGVAATVISCSEGLSATEYRIYVTGTSTTNNGGRIIIDDFEVGGDISGGTVTPPATGLNEDGTDFDSLPIDLIVEFFEDEYILDVIEELPVFDDSDITVFGLYDSEYEIYFLEIYVWNWEEADAEDFIEGLLEAGFVYDSEYEDYTIDDWYYIYVYFDDYNEVYVIGIY